ncbi:MAG: sigma-54-dependent Fis family transcriptional regulator [Candidatus Latescibacteria bacterium]|nr:sigma-54-dependent Fis family transcriptional regulator [Candidatus Latescibacterota bacterium]
MNILLLSKDNDTITAVQKYTDSKIDRLNVVSDVSLASEKIKTRDFDMVFMDCSIRPTELIMLAGEYAEELSETVVLLLGPLDHEQREQLGRRLSAHYSIDKPLRKQAFIEMLHRVKMRSTIVRKAGLIGRSSAMEEIIQTIIQIGPTPITVLITGDSGTGKEVVARALHEVSRRSDQPFLAINCAALAEGVLESELFGHEKGSFTGAATRRTGLFERAHGGTIFLDEIGEIPHSTQIRLLRVLEEREIMRVGGAEIIPVDVRIIAATNRNLAELVEKRTFRRDLYYRIKVLEIHVLPLRKRPEDIPILIDRLTRLYAEDNRLEQRRFSDEAKDTLSRMPWTGNVRELRNFIESTLALTQNPVINTYDIPPHLLRDLNRQNTLPVPSEKSTDQMERELIYRSLLDLKKDITEIKELLMENRIIARTEEYPHIREVVPIENGGESTLEELEQQAVADALEHTHGNRRKAAKLLGIGERTLYRKIKQYGIGQEDG